MRRQGISHSWRDACESELMTAQSPGDLGAIDRVITAYESLGATKEVQAALGCAGRLGLDHRKILPLLLETQVRTKALDRLNRTLAITAGLGEPLPRLRRSLARAYTLLRQPAKAVGEWKALLAIHYAQCERELHDGPMPDRFRMDKDDWRDLARFLSAHGNLNGIYEQILSQPLASADRETDAAMRLCVLMVYLEQDRTAASCTLQQIPVCALQDGDDRLLLAIAAFRLGGYALARSFLATRSGGTEAYANAARTFEVFEAATARRVPETGHAIGVPGDTVEVLDTLVATTHPSRYAWGFLEQGLGDRTASRFVPFARGGIRYLEHDGGGKIVATYSILPVHDPDPLRVLPLVDFEVPHVMVQRLVDGHACHGFTEQGGLDIWPWAPVQLVPGKAKGVGHARCRGAALWQTVLEQLESGKYRE